MIGLPKEPISPSNLKIRIPTPKVDNYIEEKSKEKKHNIFVYIMNWISCCNFDDDYYN